MDTMLFSEIVIAVFDFRLYEKIEKSMKNEHETFELCKAMNTRAPLTIRINPTKTTRSDVTIY